MSERKPFEKWTTVLRLHQEPVVTIHSANEAIEQDKAEHEKVCAYLTTKILTFYDGTALGEIKSERDQLRAQLERAKGLINWLDAENRKKGYPTGMEWSEFVKKAREFLAELNKGERLKTDLK